ncbi:hypothetical protein L5515_017271 [Caenorhabditis briggsae]|uniref:Small ubiquitin-related modifier n=1 Tax=Caenorhabditis briggsae TaxID=6238 RepID=A0AAE9JPW7_CAEBR|nr:hypothetical protein L5515_017271 [Caenorhabditis briggsae]
MADNGAAAAAAPGKDNIEYMKIKAVGQDNSEVHFLVKSGTSMAKVKKSYADRTGVSVGSLRFVLGERHISDKDTPKSLEMEDDDVIEVYQVQTGG